jgi:hypothetical protein
VHRDLKPENVFLARSRRSDEAPFDVKVLDFGIAKVMAEARATTAWSGLMGTPLYMAPEQAESAPATPAIDVWALGLIVYRALTGRYFWRSTRPGAASVTSLLREVLLDPIPRPSARAEEDGVTSLFPADLDPWITRCLEREPERRFRDAGEALAAMRGVASPWAVTQPQGESEPPPGPSPTPSPAPLSVPPPPARASAAPAAPAPVAVTLVHEEPDVKVGRVRDIAVIRWRATPTLPTVSAMDLALTRAIADFGGGPCHIMPVIDADQPSPGVDARNALARVVEQQDRHVRSVAYVVLGAGIRAAAQRGVITALVLVARPSHTTKVYATVEEAVNALAARYPESAASGDIAALIERFCG